MSPDRRRAIAPRSPPLAQASTSVPALQASPTRSRSHRKHSTTACESCRASKRRCIGGSPCSRCVTEDIPCVFPEATDGRRGRKRRLEELSARADALDALLSSIQNSDDDAVQELLSLARADRPLEELVQAANGMIRKNEIRSKSQSRVRHVVLSIASLTDNPPIRVPAWPWTTIITDDDAVSHLVSIFFTWHQCAYPAIDQDLFARDMNAKDLSCQFCSPLLVNCICLVACMYTDHESAFADPKDPTTRGTHFLAEASRLWALEEGRATMANVQAMIALISGTVVLGKDTIGSYYISQSIALAGDLVRLVRKSRKQGKPGYSGEEFERSYSSALWGAFMVQTEFALVWMKPLTLRPPSIPPPFKGPQLLAESQWQAYPNDEPVVPCYVRAINDERIQLYVIVAEMLPFILSGNPEDSPLPGQTTLDRMTKLDGLGDIDLSLQKWFRHLHPEARVEGRLDSPASGPLINLHIAYHGFQIIAQSLVLRALGANSPDRVPAKDKIIRAANGINDVFLWAQRTMGLHHFGVCYVHAAALSALNVVDYLAEPGVSALVHTMCLVLSNAARRWTLARGILKILWIRIQDRWLEAHLDAATLGLFKLNAVDNWGPDDHRLFEACAYPNYAALTERGRDFVEMGELLQEFASLQLNSKDVDTLTTSDDEEEG